MMRLLSGIQPTGRMHLGNYLGAVQNWVKLQTQFEAFFMIVDWHALTTVYEHPEKLRQDKWNLVLDLLAAGIDPQKSCLFFQSDVPQHAELHLVLSMITPLPWLERVPTYKSKIDEIQDKDLNTYGFLGYPVLQAADILLYKAQRVPVGKDQLPHLELAREIGRRFNHFYGELFPDPVEALTEFPVLNGLDGRKMSKSYGNTIPVADADDQTLTLVRGMITDPKRIRRTDPGTPEDCPVFSYHQIFTQKERQPEIAAACRSAQIGCVDCKKECGANIVTFLSEFREARRQWENRPDDVKAILADGAKRARAVAETTMVEVRDRVGI